MWQNPHMDDLPRQHKKVWHEITFVKKTAQPMEAQIIQKKKKRLSMKNYRFQDSIQQRTLLTTQSYGKQLQNIINERHNARNTPHTTTNRNLLSQ